MKICKKCKSICEDTVFDDPTWLQLCLLFLLYIFVLGVFGIPIALYLIHFWKGILNA